MSGGGGGGGSRHQTTPADEEEEGEGSRLIVQEAGERSRRRRRTTSCVRAKDGPEVFFGETFGRELRMRERGGQIMRPAKKSKAGSCLAGK